MALHHSQTGRHMINIGSYMSVHVLLNLLKSWGKAIKYEAFCNKFNKFTYTGVRKLDSIYHMALKITLKSHFWHENVKILSL